MTELRGGERVTIRHKQKPVHIFERAMSDALLQHRLQSDEWSDQRLIDLWRQITPMPRSQSHKLPDPLEVDRTAPPDVQARQTMARLGQFEQLRRVNNNIRKVFDRGEFHEVQRTEHITEDTVIVRYHLGYGIPDVAQITLW